MVTLLDIDKQGQFAMPLPETKKVNTTIYTLNT
ncbi:hypothetical protein NP493_251g02053 [Ridgeia piscesae]|uniref:Uncharacterized protein n=1 Tax=Ridgeia piscesae TaxID=27915 RepID=A0AAD9NYJ3_RIDPI|nr:hypothetical protein NP493_251g02053 [Ridgeia piscesae]